MADQQTPTGRASAATPAFASARATPIPEDWQAQLTRVTQQLEAQQTYVRAFHEEVTKNLQEHQTAAQQ